MRYKRTTVAGTWVHRGQHGFTWMDSGELAGVYCEYYPEILRIPTNSFHA
jgi:hypothetical protein